MAAAIAGRPAGGNHKYPLALTRSGARERQPECQAGEIEGSKNACTCPASPPRAPRHRSCHAGGDDDGDG